MKILGEFARPFLADSRKTSNSTCSTGGKYSWSDKLEKHSPAAKPKDQNRRPNASPPKRLREKHVQKNSYSPRETALRIMTVDETPENKRKTTWDPLEKLENRLNNGPF
jgi:hypothetical protein